MNYNSLVINNEYNFIKIQISRLKQTLMSNKNISTQYVNHIKKLLKKYETRLIELSNILHSVHHIPKKRHGFKKFTHKLGRSIKKTVKQVTPTLVLTVLSGGTLSGPVIGRTIASAIASRKIKNKKLNVVVQAALSGTPANIPKNIAKGLIVNEITERIHNPLVAQIITPVIFGEIKNEQELLKLTTNRFVNKEVMRIVYKKTHNSNLAEILGGLMSCKVEHCLQRQIQTNQKLLEQKQDLHSTKTKKISPVETKETIEQTKIKSLSDISDKRPSFNDSFNLTIDINSGKVKPFYEIKSEYSILESDMKFSQDSIEFGTKVKLTESISIGNESSFSKNEVRNGINVTTNNITTSFGTKLKKDGWNSEVRLYASRTEHISSNVPVCTKTTIRNEPLNFSLCGTKPIGTLYSEIEVCPNNTTTTNEVGLNWRGGLCAASVVPVGRIAQGSLRIVKGLDALNSLNDRIPIAIK